MQHCSSLLQLLQDAVRLCEVLQNEALEASCSSLLRKTEALKLRVEEAGSLASGGIFEWVDSPLVVVSVMLFVYRTLI